jgi:hypothetical protein
MEEETNSRLNMGNTVLFVQDLSPSILMSKNTNIEVHTRITIIVLYCKKF